MLMYVKATDESQRNIRHRNKRRNTEGKGWKEGREGKGHAGEGVREGGAGSPECGQSGEWLALHFKLIVRCVRPAITTLSAPTHRRRPLAPTITAPTTQALWETLASSSFVSGAA